MQLMRQAIPSLFLLLLLGACTQTDSPTQKDSTKKSAPQWGAQGENPSANDAPQIGTSKNTEGRRNIKEPTLESLFFAQAIAMKNAHNHKDYEQFLRYAVVPGMSTNEAHRKKLVERLKKEDAYLEQQQIRIDSLVVMPVSNMAERSGTYYALLPKKMYLTVQDKRNMNEGFLLGYTHDGGKQCYFVDLDNITEENLYQLLPDLNGLMAWPGPGKTYQLPN
ncbi:MAG: hypothetical protein RLZZ370_2040 [Bacteroidota bacterium]|jgi:hypothetical protein